MSNVLTHKLSINVRCMLSCLKRTGVHVCQVSDRSNSHMYVRIYIHIYTYTSVYTCDYEHTDVMMSHVINSFVHVYFTLKCSHDDTRQPLYILTRSTVSNVTGATPIHLGAPIHTIILRQGDGHSGSCLMLGPNVLTPHLSYYHYPALTSPNSLGTSHTHIHPGSVETEAGNISISHGFLAIKLTDIMNAIADNHNSPCILH